MSYYRPTTAEIREQWASMPEQVANRAWDEAVADAETRRIDEFDRWLAQIRAAAWDAGHEAGVEDATGADNRNPYAASELV